MIEQEGKDLVYVLYEFKKFLGNDIIIGHNVNFDIDFIYDNRYLCEPVRTEKCSPKKAGTAAGALR